jgi:hypothetical protein
MSDENIGRIGLEWCVGYVRNGGSPAVLIALEQLHRLGEGVRLGGRERDQWRDRPVMALSGSEPDGELPGDRTIGASDRDDNPL